MLQLIQYIKGYVLIRVWGYSPERFMNLCSNRDIFLWNIENHGEYYTMCITVKGFRKLKPIVKKTGTKVAIQKRCGLPFFVPKMKRRKIFLIGLLGSLFFWVWMSTFIWAVDITGNYSITEDVFFDFLRGNHIYVGMQRKDVDIETLEKRIRQDFPIVTWTSAKIEGTRLSIQIKENEVDTNTAGKEETVVNNAFGSDLVAENDGVIISMVTRKGIPQVALQSEVKKGDVLVCGSVPVYNEDATVKKYQYYDADADIYIKRNLKKQEKLPLTYKQKVYSGETKNEYFLSFSGKELVFRIGKVAYADYDRVTDKKQVKLLENFYLPIYYGKTVNREYVIEDNIYATEEIKSIFSEKSTKFIESLEEKGVQIIKKNVTISKKNKTWQMDMDLQIVEKTGKNIPIVPAPVDESEEADQAAEE
ncbi:sporulation protein YqfD [Kineothrix sp. MB12-C1]|uniref:sporulation protein YqfD n=1 Tax=Kineothrix sp. MB12-C1 TaxID=3070215 RepID=UPI0027D2E4AC|nr:sporulation protein YqfD [Kineothrix sp. MB12-C1]WMC92478.1 sporulation protein YqfD [Kineothrix sp. MB12-C1]